MGNEYVIGEFVTYTRSTAERRVQRGERETTDWERGKDRLAKRKQEI